MYGEVSSGAAQEKDDKMTMTKKEKKVIRILGVKKFDHWVCSMICN